jgi:hypothetical protein
MWVFQVSCTLVISYPNELNYITKALVENHGFEKAKDM